jgi:cobalt-zinc-cadmium efflux system membrane fusion protein
MKTTPLLFLILPTLANAAMEPVTLPAGSAEKLGLRVEALEAAPVSDPVRATGRLTLDPLATAVVASPVAGRIESDTLRRGTRVKAGDKLLTLRSAERAAAVTTYLDAEQRLRFAKAAYEREQALEVRKITTMEALRGREQELALARTAHLSAIQEMYLYGLSEVVLHDMVEEELIRGDLSEQIVTAPIDGVIIHKTTTPGAPVERNAELLKIAALDHLLVEFQVPLRGVGRVREGATVKFQTIVGDAGEGSATLTALVPAADAATLSATALARLENPDGRWISGTPVEILLDDPDAPALPAVPTGALVEIDGQRFVFVAESDTVFRPHPVEVLAESSERIGVRGLSADGTRIVTRGAALLLAAWEEAHAAE